MSIFRHLSRGLGALTADFIQCALLVFLPLMIAQGLTLAVSRFLSFPWAHVVGLLFFFMPAFAVIAHAVVNGLDITVENLLESLKDFSISAILLGAFLTPALGASMWLAAFLGSLLQNAWLPRLLMGALQGILPLLPLFFVMFLVDRMEGPLIAFVDGLLTFLRHFLFFVLFVIVFGLLQMGATAIGIPGILPVIGFIFGIFSMIARIFVQTLMVFTLGSFYWEASGKEKMEEEVMGRGKMDIKKMPSVWKKRNNTTA